MFKGFLIFKCAVTKYSKNHFIFLVFGILLFVSGLILLFLNYRWIASRYLLEVPYSIDRPLLFLGILLL